MVARRRITRLGELLRLARGALGLQQGDVAARVFTSMRTLSRWENGDAHPDAAKAERIVAVLADAPQSIVDELAELLGVDSPYAEEEEEPPAAAAPPVAPVAPAPAPEPPPAPPPPPPLPEPAPPPPEVVAPPRPSDDELRAAFDTLVLAAAEERDVLPRHLRAFGVELLLAVDRAGLAPKDGAALLAARDRRSSSS